VGPHRAQLTLDTVEQIFDHNGWRYEVIENHLITAFEDVPMILFVDERRGILLLFVPLVPGRGMQGYRPARPEAERDVAVYIGSVNYRLALGAFTRDHSDGEIRYEVSVPVADGNLSDELLRLVIAVTVAAVTQRAPTIFALREGRVSLQQALTQLDSGQDIPPAMVV
jgi:hypothetical protein